MRLDWARVDSSQYGTLDLDYGYDRFGNMLSRVATLAGGPPGLHFADRSYADNRIADPGFAFDANGNLTAQPPEGVLPGWAYGFSPENRLDQVRGLDAYGLPDGEILQESRYDPSGNRWVASRWADGGVGRITLRDATGQVASEYTERAGNVAPELEKEYVRAAGRLLVVNSACGPRPDLAADRPATTGTTARFVKTDHVAPVRDFTILIRAEDGRSRTLSRPADLPDEFGIDQSDLYPDVTNWVYLQTDAECGHTGYSNGVSYAFSTSDPGDRYIADSLARDPITTLAGSSSDAVVLAGGVIFDGPGKPPPPPPPPPVQSAPSVNAQHVHTDHLGSTRLMTDEEGAEIGRFKYYPFGHEAESLGASDNRMKFTGHERDQEIGLDYMLARYYGAGLGRFLSVDPRDDVQSENVQSWNKYSYSRNSPAVLKDPDGRTVVSYATDPFAVASLDSLAMLSPTFQALMDDPNVLVNVRNIDYPDDVCSDLMRDGGMASLQFDTRTGNTTIDVSIDPTLAGAATAEELGKPGLKGSPEAIDGLVRFETALGVLSQADPEGTAETVARGSGGHPLTDERTEVARKMDEERSTASDR